MPQGPAMPPTEGSVDAVEELAKLVERNEAALLDMGFKPHFMRAGLAYAADAYRVAQRAGDARGIAAADAEMRRVLRTTMERLAEGGITAAGRLVGPRQRSR